MYEYFRKKKVSNFKWLLFLCLLLQDVGFLNQWYSKIAYSEAFLLLVQRKRGSFWVRWMIFRVFCNCNDVLRKVFSWNVSEIQWALWNILRALLLKLQFVCGLLIAQASFEKLIFISKNLKHDSICRGKPQKFAKKSFLKVQLFLVWFKWHQLEMSEHKKML